MSRPAHPEAAPPRPLALSDEERVESAKYAGRDVPPRAFEEERFLFPESYGANRVRLLVKDPEWLFAYWDLTPDALADVRREMGQRVAALARLTLQVEDEAGGRYVTLLPNGARAWYLKSAAGPVKYRATLGLTLPSGEFRALAQSNEVAPPRTGASTATARRRASFAELGSLRGALPLPAADAPTPAAPAAPPDSAEGPAEARGGASDVYQRRGGASDLYRR